MPCSPSPLCRYHYHTCTHTRTRIHTWAPQLLLSVITSIKGERERPPPLPPRRHPKIFSLQKSTAHNNTPQDTIAPMSTRKMGWRTKNRMDLASSPCHEEPCRCSKMGYRPCTYLPYTVSGRTHNAALSRYTDTCAPLAKNQTGLNPRLEIQM